MTRTPVDVICQFSREGAIIPLKVRIVDEDGETQNITIQSYKELSAYVEGQAASAYSHGHLRKYECIITVYGMQKHIYLSYNAIESMWYIEYK